MELEHVTQAKHRALQIPCSVSPKIHLKKGSLVLPGSGFHGIYPPSNNGSGQEGLEEHNVHLGFVTPATPEQ